MQNDSLNQYDRKTEISLTEMSKVNRKMTRSEKKRLRIENMKSKYKTNPVLFVPKTDKKQNGKVSVLNAKKWTDDKEDEEYKLNFVEKPFSQFGNGFSYNVFGNGYGAPINDDYKTRIYQFVNHPLWCLYTANHKSMIRMTTASSLPL